jgi:hypothetical protein
MFGAKNLPVRQLRLLLFGMPRIRQSLAFASFFRSGPIAQAPEVESSSPLSRCSMIKI